jgi:PAS domain S-box-containing protein
MSKGLEGRRDSTSRRFQPQTGTLDAVLAASPDLVYLCDRSGTFLYANHPGAREWGMNRGEILGRSWNDLGLPGDVLDLLASLRERAFDTGHAQVERVPIPTPQGVRECECFLTPIHDDGGAVEVVVIAFRDVSGSKQAERALHESEENYRLLAENSTDMISRHDPQGRYLYVSPACRALLGYEPEELLGHSAYEFIHPDDRAAVSWTRSTILGYPETRTIVFRVRRKPGDYLWFETTTRTIRAPESGEIVEIQCASRDVTARKLAEDALRENRELLQAVLDKLALDVAQAARYVRSLLPETRTRGPVLADWRFIPSAQLGGDTFQYHWIDDDHLAIYLIDVSGHGVGPALLSVSALNALRSQSLPQTDFRQPGQVLAALNRAFQMDQQNGLYFTIWYGIYQKPTRQIVFSGGGHPPALLLTGPSVEQATMKVLDSQGPMIGADLDIEFATTTCPVEDFGLLYVFSDGVFEIEQADGEMWPFSAFLDFMRQEPLPGESRMDRLIQNARTLSGQEEFQDDFSIVELRFAPPE